MRQQTTQHTSLVGETVFPQTTDNELRPGTTNGAGYEQLDDIHSPIKRTTTETAALAATYSMYANAVDYTFFSDIIYDQRRC